MTCFSMEAETLAELWERALIDFDCTVKMCCGEQISEQEFLGGQLTSLIYYEEYLYGECQITEEILEAAKAEQRALLSWLDRDINGIII